MKLEIDPPRPSAQAAERASSPAIDSVDILEIVERAPAVRRLVVAAVASPAIARETTSLAGVPTLKELLAARAEAREREIAERAERATSGFASSTRGAREAPLLFPSASTTAPRAPQLRRDVEGERALFAIGTFVGALAVGLSVLLAMLLK